MPKKKKPVITPQNKAVMEAPENKAEAEALKAAAMPWDGDDADEDDTPSCDAPESK